MIRAIPVGTPEIGSFKVIPPAIGPLRTERVRATDVPGVPAHVWAQEQIERGALHVVVDPVVAVVDGGPWSAVATFPA